MILSLTASAVVDATSAVRWEDLPVDPVALDLGFFQLRWYSLGYLAGIIIGWWYLLKLLARPGAPMARRHADDMVFYATLGILLGGRLGYIFFYRPSILADPIDIFKLWEGGMSFHGGVIGTSLGIIYMARKYGLNWLRVHDYVACCAPFGIFFVRLANFANGELWGRGPTSVPWAMIFPTGGEVPRHPSQLYEAGLEGLLLGLVLWFLFWKTDARYQPGRLVGTFILVYGLSRFGVEFFRQPDEQLTRFAIESGLSMGQWLTLPMILGGIYLIATSKGRRERVEPIAGHESVA